jgi:serine/threonine protein phosphatase PrpC
MMLRAVESICLSDTGLQRRENEDSAYAASPLFVVADGMGGAQAGEVASRIAIETFQSGLGDAGSPEQRLAERVQTANRQIYDRSRTETGREGMGTTLTAAYLDDGQLAIAHVGDSRAYLFRDGQLSRLTQDHSLVDELVRRGKLTEEQAAEHPQRSIITRALGPEPDVEVDTFSYPVKPEDVLLLCSDGLTSMISEDAVAGVLGAAHSLEEAARTLIRKANDAGGRDNITVVLFRLEEVATGADGGGAGDQPTIIEPPSESSPSSAGAAAAREAAAGAAVAVAPGPASRLRPRGPQTGQAQPRVRNKRRTRLVAGLVAVLVVLLLVGGGGYLATRQLYFIGTNSQGVVTIYRGLPYELPAGIPLYETYFESGVPASLVPADRRRRIFNNDLRSQSDALNLVRNIELGRVSK